MNRTLKVLVGLLLLTGVVQAQQQTQNDEPKYNIGAGFGMPQGRANDFADLGANFTIGGGCNINRWVGVSGEIMYQGLPIQQSVRTQIRVADASSHLYGLTGNVIFRAPIKDRFGFYLIGGGGLYRRTFVSAAGQTAQNFTPRTYTDGKKAKVKGVIAGRSGDTMTVRDKDNTVTTALLDNNTKVESPKVLWWKERRNVTNLIPGLWVEVKGSGNSQGQLMADKIIFDNKSMQLAQTISGGTAPLEAEQEQLSGRQRKVEAEQAQMQSQQQKMEGQQAEMVTAQHHRE
jgi:hypothetical protein